MKTVLAAIDFSPVTRRVLKTAVDLARGMGGRVVLFHAVQPPLIVTEFSPPLGEAFQLAGEIERASRRRLLELRRRRATRGVAIDVICRQGPAVPLIVDLARQLAFGYIVLGSHGHTAFHDLVAGGTASGVLKRAPCPVVVVPALRRKPVQRKAGRGARIGRRPANRRRR